MCDSSALDHRQSASALEQAADRILEDASPGLRSADKEASSNSSRRIGGFLRRHRTDWEAGRVVLPAWANYRNVVRTDAWRRHFVGTWDKPLPILMVACPHCGSGPWQNCTKHGKTFHRHHGPRLQAALAKVREGAAT